MGRACTMSTRQQAFPPCDFDSNRCFRYQTKYGNCLFSIKASLCLLENVVFELVCGCGSDDRHLHSVQDQLCYCSCGVKASTALQFDIASPCVNLHEQIRLQLQLSQQYRRIQH